MARPSCRKHRLHTPQAPSARPLACPVLRLALLLLLLPCVLPLSADAPGGPLTGFCPDGKVPRTDTPIYNGPSPASVVHDYRVEFRQLDAHRGEAHFVRSVTVHSPYGADAARFAVVSSRFIHLKDFKGTVHDAGGKQLARLRRSDLREATLNDGLASDDRLHYYEGPRGSFPFTVRYEWTCTYDNGLLRYPDFRPQDDIRQAVEHASYTLTLPASVRLLYRSRGLAAHPEETADAGAGTRTYRWQADDLPAAVPREDTVWEPPTVQAQPADFVCEGYEGQQDTWEHFGQWLYRLTEGRDRLTADEAATVHRLTDGLSTPEAKAHALYDYLAEHTRYVSIQLGIGGWQPMTAEQVCRTKFGDCKALTNYLKALLAEAGVPSVYTVISTRKARIDDYPGIGQMDHVVLGVPCPTDTLWLECTAARLPFGYRHRLIAGHDALLVTPEGGRMVRLPDYDAEQQEQSVRARLQVGRDGMASGRVSLHNRLRFYEEALPLKDLKPTELAHRLTEGLACTMVRIDSVSRTEDDGPLPSLTIGYRLSARYARPVPPRLFLTLNPFRRADRLSRTRTLPDGSWELTESASYSDTLDVVLPAGSRCEALPPEVSGSHAFGSLSSVVSLSDGRLRIRQRLLLRKGVYPASERAAWEAFVRRIKEAYAGRIAILIENQSTTGPQPAHSGKTDPPDRAERQPAP